MEGGPLRRHRHRALRAGGGTGSVSRARHRGCRLRELRDRSRSHGPVRQGDGLHRRVLAGTGERDHAGAGLRGAARSRSRARRPRRAGRQHPQPVQPGGSDREPSGRRFRTGGAPRRRQARRQAAADYSAPPRSERVGHRAGRRSCVPARLAGRGPRHRRGSAGGSPRAQPPGRDPARTRGVTSLQSVDEQLPLRRSRSNRRSEPGYRQVRGRPLRGRERLGNDDEPGDRRGADLRRRRPGDRWRNAGGDRVRRRRPASDDVVHGLRVADGGRRTRHRARVARDAGVGRPWGYEGSGRGRHSPPCSSPRKRDRRRTLASRRRDRRVAARPVPHLAPHRREVFPDIARRRQRPDGRSSARATVAATSDAGGRVLLDFGVRLAPHAMGM